MLHLLSSRHQVQPSAGDDDQVRRATRRRFLEFTKHDHSTGELNNQLRREQERVTEPAILTVMSRNALAPPEGTDGTRARPKALRDITKGSSKG